MGGRRKSNKIQKREKPITVKTIFDCGICGYKNCVFVKIKKIVKSAHLFCVKCDNEFNTQVRSMDEPIDVFHKWLQFLKQNKSKGPVQTENRFEDQSSEPEAEDLEVLLKTKPKQQHDDQDDIFSEDSLGKEKPVKLGNDSINMSDDSLKEVDSGDDSMISDIDSDEELRKKVKVQ